MLKYVTLEMVELKKLIIVQVGGGDGPCIFKSSLELCVASYPGLIFEVLTNIYTI